MLSYNVLLRTRRVLSLYKVLNGTLLHIGPFWFSTEHCYTSFRALLVLNRTLLHIVRALLVLEHCYTLLVLVLNGTLLHIVSALLVLMEHCYTSLGPFWFSTEHCYTLLVPFWFCYTSLVPFVLNGTLLHIVSGSQQNIVTHR